VSIAVPSLLLPVLPTPPLTLAACARSRVVPAWMQEEGAPVEGAADAAPEEAAADDPKAAVAAEKKELREKIAALEKELVGARGTLLSEQDAVKDAGESGYMLLAANFERFRQKSREELTSQEAVGRVKGAGYLMSFADTFDELQASAADSGEDEGKIHSYYAGIHKQFKTLLDGWQVAPIEPAAGEMADFSKHVTLERVEDEAAAGTILEAKRKGYTMGGATVRSAEVVTSKGPKVEEPPAEEAAAEEGAGEAAAADEETPAE